MGYLLLTFAIIFSALNSTLGKLNGHLNGDPLAFNFYKAITSFLMFLIAAIISNETLHLPTFGYALLYGLCLSISNYCGYCAVLAGPMALSNMIASFSLILPTLFGIFFLNENLNIRGIIGLIFIILSFICINPKVEKTEQKLSATWWKNILITFFTNGFFAIIQIYYKKIYSDTHQYTFLYAAMFFSAIIFGLLWFKKRKSCTLKQAFIASLSGISTGLHNLMLFAVISILPVSFVYPISSIAIAFLIIIIGRIFFGEKLLFNQLFAFLTGVLAIFLLKI